MPAFLAPWVLLGGLAVGIPIALHFFFRSRYRKVPWAAMDFLLASIEQTSRRLKFQEILLLILRCAVVLLIALALARPLEPSWWIGRASAGGAARDSVDAVMIMDVSYSMTARDGPGTRLDRAKSAAQAVVDHLPPHSTVTLIVAADRVIQAPKTLSNMDQAKQAIGSLEASQLASDLFPAIARAQDVLKRAQLPNKELYLFSDMQRTAWDAQAGPLVDKLKAIRQDANVYLVRCGTQVPKNAAITGIVPQSGIPHTGERAGFVVFVRNSGPDPVQDLEVTLTVDGAKVEKDKVPIKSLAKGETKAVPLAVRLDKPGLRVVSAELNHDDVAADNRFDRLIQVRDQARILVVDGSPNEREPERSSSYFLMHSLRPVPELAWGKYHIQPRMVTAGQASASLLNDKDVCILVNVPLGGPRGDVARLSPEFLERLKAFVNEGKGLWIFGGAQVHAKAYNEILGDTHGLMPVTLLKDNIAVPTDQPFRLDPRSAPARSYLSGWLEDAAPEVGQVEAVQALAVEEPAKPALLPKADRDAAEKEPAEKVDKPGKDKGEAASVLLRFSNGKPAIVARRVGDGEVVLVTTSADTAWTDLPLRPTYVPFVHLTLNHLLQGQTERLNRVAGQPLRWYPPEIDLNRGFALLAPDGKRTRLGQPERVEGRLVVAATDTPRAGIYRIIPADREPEAGEPIVEGTPFAVVPDLRESEDLSSLTDPQLDDRLGIKVTHLTAGGDLAAFSGDERNNREWTTKLLWILLAVAVGEALLAWYCGRAS